MWWCTVTQILKIFFNKLKHSSKLLKPSQCSLTMHSIPYIKMKKMCCWCEGRKHFQSHAQRAKIWDETQVLRKSELECWLFRTTKVFHILKHKLCFCCSAEWRFKLLNSKRKKVSCASPTGKYPCLKKMCTHLCLVNCKQDE